ncbi:cobalamin biosynthesis protein CbiM [Pilimelia anulata]|uniref:Cobalamin biosynthesis protein CbiM n=1 Tax=Pilimelia anulata TaxID=53371 RepID=A0A8J3B9W0_9ACTN|nr:energy-coupling factor ABC transporter permease [Pilimelia anulata]GGK06299.1 cobalamin biosynthesis protein CbiM [Pilimelia anulata]
MRTLALHLGNGIIDGPTSLAFLALAAAAVALCVRRARRDLDDRLVPLAGLVAAFVFAVQMLNFPVLPGVSGHLLGGALAAALVGPWVGALCVTVVLVVQALVFADGGVTAIGLNVTNMALLHTAVAYLVIRLALRLLPRTAGGLAAAAGAGAVVATVVASQGFVLQYALGGVGPLPAGGLAAVAGTMAGVHLLIGVGEGVITAVTVAAVARSRPDLVHALRGRPLPEPAGAAA